MSVALYYGVVGVFYKKKQPACKICIVLFYIMNFIYVFLTICYKVNFIKLIIL